MKVWLITACLLYGHGSQADDYNHIAQDTFWTGLYDGGGYTLYCGYRFERDGSSANGRTVGIDHLYETEWMIDYLGCVTRARCYAEQPDKFIPMESDLHNLYPAWTELTVYRLGRRFGEVEGEDWRFDDCDFEWKAGIVEPRELSRGNIARSIFYMRDRYRLPVDETMLRTLRDWNRADPPSEQERVRNDRIERIQGRRNPYIDNPALADQAGDRPAR